MRITEQPMGCQPSFDTMYRYLDGAIEMDEQAAIRQHLDDCENCTHVYNAQSELKRAIAASCRIDPPAGLADKVFAAVLASKPEPDDGDSETLNSQMTTSVLDEAPTTETETP